MNKSRRKTLKEIQDKIDSIRRDIEGFCEQLEEVREDIDAVKDEEEEAYDNLPDSLQEGERGERMQEVIDFLDSASGVVDDIYSTIMSAIGDFDCVMENINEAVAR